MQILPIKSFLRILAVPVICHNSQPVESNACKFLQLSNVTDMREPFDSNYIESPKIVKLKKDFREKVSHLPKNALNAWIDSTPASLRTSTAIGLASGFTVLVIHPLGAALAKSLIDFRVPNYSDISVHGLTINVSRAVIKWFALSLLNTQCEKLIQQMSGQFNNSKINKPLATITATLITCTLLSPFERLQSKQIFDNQTILKALHSILNSKVGWPDLFTGLSNSIFTSLLTYGSYELGQLLGNTEQDKNKYFMRIRTVITPILTLAIILKNYQHRFGDNSIQAFERLKISFDEKPAAVIAHFITNILFHAQLSGHIYIKVNRFLKTHFKIHSN